jgi:hypothetical protein
MNNVRCTGKDAFRKPGAFNKSVCASKGQVKIDSQNLFARLRVSIHDIYDTAQYFKNSEKLLWLGSGYLP